MKVYVMAELTVTDPAWVRDYVANVTPLVESVGGKFLARTTKVEHIEGERDAPQTAVIIQFPSREAFTEFYESEAYQPYKQARQAGSTSTFFLVAGEDFAAR